MGEQLRLKQAEVKLDAVKEEFGRTCDKIRRRIEVLSLDLGGVSQVAADLQDGPFVGGRSPAQIVLGQAPYRLADEVRDLSQIGGDTGSVHHRDYSRCRRRLPGTYGYCWGGTAFLAAVSSSPPEAAACSSKYEVWSS